MKDFSFTADVRFKAKDLMDAFRILGEHFTTLAQGGDPPVFEGEGEMNILPLRPFCYVDEGGSWWNGFTDDDDNIYPNPAGFLAKSNA